MLMHHPSATSYYANIPSMSTLVPLPEMQTTEADLVIGAIGKNHVQYQEPVNDPFFAAHVPLNNWHQGYSNATYYLSDFPVAMFACKEQVRLRRVTLSRCRISKLTISLVPVLFQTDERFRIMHIPPRRKVKCIRSRFS
jgi:hypothetical protein